MQEVYDFLVKCKSYYLATVEGGQPRVRPFGTADIYDNRLYILTGKNKDVAKQINVNPNIEMCAYDGDIWLRVRAVAVEVDNREAKKHMLDTYPFLRSTYSEDDSNTLLLCLKDAVATFTTFEGEVKSITF